MNDFYADVHRRRYERYIRREAIRKWEADRPRRVLKYIATGLGYCAFAILFITYLFVGALWASL